MNDAYESFHSTLEAQGRSLVRFIQPPAAALSPPTMLLETLSTLREIMHVYNDSRLDSMDSEQEALKRQADLTRVLKESLDPAVLMCEKMGEFRSTEWEKNLFKINCLDCIGLVLEGFDFTKEKQLELEEAKSIAVNGLIEEHVIIYFCTVVLDKLADISFLVLEFTHRVWTGSNLSSIRNKR